MIKKLCKYLDEDEIKEIDEKIHNNQEKNNINNNLIELTNIINILNKRYYKFNDNIEFTVMETIKAVIGCYFYNFIDYNKNNCIDENTMLYFYNSLFDEPQNYNICERITMQISTNYYDNIIENKYSINNYNQFYNNENPLNFFIDKYNNSYIFKNNKLNDKFISFIIYQYIYLYSLFCNEYYDFNSIENNEIIYNFIESILKNIKNKNKFNKNDKYFIKAILKNFIDLFKEEGEYLEWLIKFIKPMVFNYFINNKFNDKSINEFIYKKLMTEF